MGPAVWTVLGAGSILPRAGYGCSGYALVAEPGGGITLFDCGPGTLRSLAASGLGLSDLGRVVISHFHPDHCLDLAALAFARRNPNSEARPLELVGPHGLGDWLERVAGALGPSVRFEGVRVREVRPGDSLPAASESEPTLSCVATGHKAEALAWRADLGARGSVVYSGDSGEVDALAELARDTDLFVCECSFPEREAIPSHLTPRGAGRLAQRARCRTLLLTHFYPSMQPARAAIEAGEVFDGAVELARDGSRHFLLEAPWS